MLNKESRQIHGGFLCFVMEHCLFLGWKLRNRRNHRLVELLYSQKLDELIERRHTSRLSICPAADIHHSRQLDTGNSLADGVPLILGDCLLQINLSPQIQQQLLHRLN